MVQRFTRLLLTPLLLLSLAAGGLALFAPAVPAAAYNPLNKACSAVAGNDSSACSTESQNTPVAGPDGIIVRATRLVAAVAGVAAVIMMVIYGISLTTSYGDSNKARTARNGIIAAAIGLLVVVLAQAIVVFVVSNI